LLEAPAKIDFEFLQIAPDERLFRQKNVPVAVLLEGSFRSLYTGRMPANMRELFRQLNYPVLNQTENPNRMIVVADGDIAMNQYSQYTGPLQMGTNVFTRYTYANKDFFQNALEYLVNPSDILQARSKEYTLRLLDPRKTRDQKTTWQVLTIALPILLVIVFGWVYSQWRRRYYAGK
jgi:ABC-2 type transport system permease protein